MAWPSITENTTLATKAFFEEIRAFIEGRANGSGTVVFQPEDYGAKASGDSSAAFNAMTAAIKAQSATNVAIILGPTYELNGAQITTYGGNAIWPFVPNYGEDKGRHLEIFAAPGGTNITSTVNSGRAYSAEHGTPSIIGGPTMEANGPTPNFSPWTVSFRGDLHVYSGASATTLAGVDLCRVGNPGSNFDTLTAQGYLTASRPDLFGIRLPEGDNGGAGGGWAEGRGFYAGVVCNSSQTDVFHIFTYGNVVGLGITGNEQYAGNDGHSSFISNLQTFHDKYHIASWSPTEGAISLPSGKPAQLVIGLWDIEDLPAGHSSEGEQTTDHLLDANNELKGCANYARVLAFAGRQSGPLTVSGGTGFGRTDITVPYPGAWTALTMGAKVQAATPCSARLENGGKTVRLRGIAEVKAGETLGKGETLATLPVGYRPAETQYMECALKATGSVIELIIHTDGTITLEGAATETNYVALSNRTFPTN